mmetsp:Transcript_26721/g.50224  ORF Transcript_26721/g.50224 Transcript_26721/m.50224 type:complete len:385 (+) Transcript_26721:54-1208(+)
MDDGGARPLYAVLGLAPDAPAEEVKQAYRRLALQHHPDKCQDSARLAEAEALFARIAFAYEVLGDAQRRKRYDLTGELPQNDTAAGRSAQETFLKEYMKSAPKTARAATQADYSLHSLDNYEILEVDGTNVPSYMREIVARGLGYLAAVVEGMEGKEVVLLRHFVMDQMYALLAYTPPLDAGAFAGDRGYVITYYDAPLQAGIQASWSDQNGPSGHSGGSSLAQLRTIDGEAVERRRLAALEWVASDKLPAAAAVRPKLPGEGLTEERLRAAAVLLAQQEPDLGSFTSSRLRRDLEEILGLAQGGLQAYGSSRLMGIVLDASEEVQEDGEPAKDEGQQAEGPPAIAAIEAPSQKTTALAPEPCCSGGCWHRCVDDARKMIRGRL